MKPNKSARLPLYARGGEVITSVSRFFKQPDVYHTGIENTDFKKSGKGGALSRMSGDTKSALLPKEGARK